MSSHPGKEEAQVRRQDRVTIRQVPTGVPGLDEILGGGLPEYSFNIIAGAPGCGKTTLAHQIVFANASPQNPALYFTVLGEPAIKMLRYQQQFSFFDQAKLDGSIRFVNLSQTVLDQDLGAVLDAIIKEVEASSAKIVVVDSFRTVVRRAQATSTSEVELQGFIQRLALHLTSWQATTFLIGEYVEGELRDNPVFTVADGLFWLYQSVERNSIVRKMQVMKLRGQESVPGMDTFRITESGLQAFPRTLGLAAVADRAKGERRLSTGIREFDVIMGGGIPEGDSMLLAGPSGQGNPCWPRSSSRRVFVRGSPVSSPFSRNSRRRTSAEPRSSASTLKRRRRMASSKSSISARWTFPWTRLYTPSSARSKKSMPNGWYLIRSSALKWR